MLCAFLQPEVHQCFHQEVAYLKHHFCNLGHGGDAYVLGDASNGLQWHVYVADADHTAPRPQSAPATYSLEVCMTELCPEKALQFFRSDSFISAQHTSTSSGIQSLLPTAQIDDYVFEPCGYSMNSMEGAGFATIHITPEDGFSYASFEVSNYATSSLDINKLVSTVVDIFNPGKMTVALTVDTNLPCCMWGESVQTPNRYTCHAQTSQQFTCGGRTAFYSMARNAKQSPDSDPVSPMTVLERPASLMSFSGVSDSDRFSSIDTASSAGEARCAAPKEAVVQASPVDDALDSQRVSVMKVLECFNATMVEVGNDAAYDAFIKKVHSVTPLGQTYNLLPNCSLGSYSVHCSNQILPFFSWCLQMCCTLSTAPDKSRGVKLPCMVACTSLSGCVCVCVDSCTSCLPLSMLELPCVA